MTLPTPRGRAARPSSGREPTARWLAAAVTSGVGAALLAGFIALLPAARHDDRLLLAPMMALAPQPCPAAQHPPATPVATSPRPPDCAADATPRAQLVEATLDALAPRAVGGASARFELGYTLQIPLLRLFKRRDSAPTPGAASAAAPDRWVIDSDAVQRLVQTLSDDPRPAIVYLFSTHFGIGAPIEAELAQDASNLAATPLGAMRADRYYSIDIYPWGVATTDNPITQRRAQAIDAVVDAICALPAASRARIRGLTLLGEVHQLFPDFEAGMGFAPPYLVSDYSRRSVENFRTFLRQRFGSVAALNAHLGNDAHDAYRSFAQVEPPARDIRTQPLRRFVEHIDSYAHGTLPIAGWIGRAADGAPRRVRIYLDGALLARVPADLGRQDVLAALPELGTANVGWRHDLDFTRLPPGIHRIDLLLEQLAAGASAGPVEPRLARLGTRYISIMGRDQRPPLPAPSRALPPSEPVQGDTRFFIDQPAEGAAYWFNPLAPLWHEFRNNQIVRYLDFFDRRVGRSCLWDTPRYLHQIVPFTNPSWDANKFAVDASLRAAGGVRLGVSLYGDASYGTAFLGALEGWRRDRYGVTEFHPLTRLTPAELRDTLERHRAHGADFVSFFLETRSSLEQRVPGTANIFSFDPDNPRFGSDALYRSMQSVLENDAAR